jgi:hypothetical protein
MRHHHRVDDEGADPDDLGQLANFGHDLAVVAELARVLQDQDMSVHAQHLVAKFSAKTAGHAHHGSQGGGPERHAQDGEDRAHGNERTLPGAHVAERQVQRKTHRDSV